MREVNKIAEGLFEKIRDRFEDVSLGDENAKATHDPEKARFFNFDYVVDGKNHGNITISLIDEMTLKIYFSKNISHKLDGDERKTWYSFLKELREFAKRNLLSFEPRDITRSTLKHRDIQQQSKADSTYSKDEVVSESRLHGTSRSSYQECGPVKIIVRHTDRVDPEQRGARARHIKSIYLETHEGERFKLPMNNLRYARAMARHMSEGGGMSDEFGQHITEVAEACNKLRPFKSAMRTRTFEDAETQSMVEAAFEYHGLLTNTLKRMTGRKGYHACKESFKQDDTLMDEFDVDSLRERFVKRTYNDRMDDALPLVQKAYQMKKQNKFASQFESWADSVVEESSWQLPDHNDLDSLIELLGEPLPVGVDAINATNALEGIIGDDDLIDDLQALAESDPEADARDYIMGWLQSETPELYQAVMREVGDIDSDYGDEEVAESGTGDAPIDSMSRTELLDYLGASPEDVMNASDDQLRAAANQKAESLPEGNVYGATTMDEPNVNEEDYDEDQVESIATAIIRRITNNIGQHQELLMKAGPDGVMNAARDVASFHAPVEELGSSDISIMVREVYREVGVEYPEMNEGIVDTIRGMNYKRLADRSFNKAMNAQDDTMKYGLADRRRGKHEKEFNKQMDKMRQRTDKAKSLGIDESKMSDMDIDISDLTDQEFLEKYNHTKQQAIDGDWENHYEPETMPEPTDESIGDDAMTPQQKNIKMKRMGAKELSTLDKLKMVPRQLKAFAKGDSEDDLVNYNKQFNEELEQMRKIAGLK